MHQVTTPLLPIVFISVLVFQIIYITWQWIFVRKTEYLYYIGYMVVISLYVMVMYHGRLPFGAPCWNHDPIPLWGHILPMFSYLMYYRFARYFVDMKTVFPALNVWVKRMEYLLAGYLVFEFGITALGVDEQWSEHAFEAISVILFACTFIFLFSFLTKRVRVTYYLGVGALVLNLGAFGTMLLILTEEQGGAPLGFDPYWPFALATLFDLLAFTTGLAYKANLTVKNSLQTQIDYSRELQQNMVLSQKMYEIKQNLATRLHSELINALGNISSYAGLAKKEVQAGDTAKGLLYINKINLLGKHEIERINDLIWSIGPENTLAEKLKHKLQAVWGEGEEPLPPLWVELDPKNADLDADTSVVLGLIRMVRGLKDGMLPDDRTLPSIKITVAEGRLLMHTNMNPAKPEAFYENCFGGYLISVEGNNEKRITVATRRD